jgi:uncharacterized surface protein with fasciclin (FAS1) repeats
MSKLLPLLAGLLLASACAAPVEETPAPAAARPAVTNPVVGGSPMYATYNIVQNASNSNEHRTLVSAVRAAGLADTLSGAGPYTVFAPTDAAFQRLPQGTLDALMVAGNRALLARLLNYHVVPGSKTRAQIASDMRAGGGAASYRTLEGSLIRVTVQGDMLVVTDIHGNRSNVTIGDVIQSNGVIHVLDGVLLPTI